MFREIVKKILVFVLLCALPCYAECIKSKCTRPIPEAVLNFNDYNKDPHMCIIYYTDWNGYEVYHVHWYPLKGEPSYGKPFYKGPGIFLLYDGKNVRMHTKEEFNIFELERKNVSSVYAQLRECNKD